MSDIGNEAPLCRSVGIFHDNEIAAGRSSKLLAGADALLGEDDPPPEHAMSKRLKTIINRLLKKSIMKCFMLLKYNHKLTTLPVGKLFLDCIFYLRLKP